VAYQNVWLFKRLGSNPNNVGNTVPAAQSPIRALLVEDESRLRIGNRK